MTAVGVVVPPDNHVADLEAAAALDRMCTVHVARLPAARSLPMRQRLARYNTNLGETVDGLVELDPSATLVACTGSSYLLGPEEDDRLYANLSSRVGHTVRGACRCIREDLAHAGTARIVLVSPYQRWLTDLSAAYWSDAGLEVVRVREVGGGRHPYDIGEAEMEAVVREVAGTADDAVVVTGTGVPTMGALQRLGRPAVPVLSSMHCGIAWLRAMVAAPAEGPAPLGEGDHDHAS